MLHSEFTPHAFITLSNCGGIEIMLNRSADGVYYRFNYGQDNIQDEEIFEAEIEYDNDEDATTYFAHNYGTHSVPYYLNQAMRIA